MYVFINTFSTLLAMACTLFMLCTPEYYKFRVASTNSISIIHFTVKTVIYDTVIKSPINKKSLNGPIKLCFGTIC
jgi:hypothetical protein